MVETLETMVTRMVPPIVVILVILVAHCCQTFPQVSANIVILVTCHGVLARETTKPRQQCRGFEQMYGQAPGRYSTAALALPNPTDLLFTPSGPRAR